MRRQFTSYEWQTIQQRPSEPEQLEIFMRHWVGSFPRAYFLIISQDNLRIKLYIIT